MVPDLAGWRVERMPELPELAYFTLAPDWVCEVLSKSSENVDRNEKLPIYLEAGVPHVWIVDPIEQTLEVYHRGDGPRWREVRTYASDARVRAQPFEAVELDLASPWSKPRRG
jgi:Uma2 family endonuclease